MKYKVKKGTEVVVITGEHKGKRGKILEVLRDSQRVVIEGINLRKKFLKKSQENPNGGIIEKEMPIHYSNIKVVADKPEAKQEEVK